MLARELMVRPVATTTAQASLAHVAAMMRDHECGSVVVLREGNRPIAMITDRDVCMSALRSNRPLSDLRVEQAMSRKLHTCRPDDEVARVLEQMSLHQVRRMPVVDEVGRILGLVCLDDIARVAGRQVDLFAPSVSTGGVGRALGEICRPHLQGLHEAGLGGGAGPIQ